MVFVVALVLFLVYNPVCSRHAGAYSWYSTIGELRTLMLEDSDLLKLFHKRLIVGRYQVTIFLGKLEELRKSGEKMLQAHYKSNGILTSAELVGRYEARWKNVARTSNFKFGKEFVNLSHQALVVFPQIEDMFSVLDALLVLQKSYNLKTEDIANGYILGKQVGKPLSVSSCEYIAQKVCSDESFELCLEWANVTKNLLKCSNNAMTTPDMIEKVIEMERNKILFARLCESSISGKFDGSKSGGKDLKCSLWTNYGHPWLILQPVPMETMSVSPWVVVFYKVISDKDIDYVKSLAAKKLGSARTFNKETSIKVDSYRVAHNCWLSRANNSIISKLDTLVSAITGLNVRRTSEQLQVANYGIGGHYGPHTDPLDLSQQEEIKRRNRKATFMFYLSDVEHGGTTVFLSPGIAVNPVKGSAVFWYNLLPSGVADERTVHGSCPVILGDNWVANKWIWETKSEKCELKDYFEKLQS